MADSVVRIVASVAFLILVILLVSVSVQLQFISQAGALPLDLVHVGLHQQHTLDQVLEIVGHSVQKLLQRGLDLLHFAFEASNAVLELLAH